MNVSLLSIFLNSKRGGYKLEGYIPVKLNEV